MQKGISNQAKWIAPALMAASTVAAVGTMWQRLKKKTLPQIDGRIQITGLHHPVEILRDKHGVPHIYAQNDHDLFFAQGYVHAQDRLFQMDINRRIGSGRLSELVGPLALKSDRFARILGWPRVISAQINGGDEGAWDIANAFTDGVNAFIAQGKYPIEYKILATKPAPWQVEDTSAWGTVLAWGLAANWEAELMRGMLLNELGAAKTADLTLTIHDETHEKFGDDAVGIDFAQQMMDTYQEIMSTLPIGQIPTGTGIGSNNWVVHGDHTTTGRPFLANDPHLPPIFPSIWYENHLVGGRYNVTGFSTPGVPGVLIGHNEHVAWGITNGFPDVQDIFVERFHPDDDTLVAVEGGYEKVEVVAEVIHVRGKRKPIVQQVRYTKHGPIISDLLAQEERPLSLAWASYTENNHLRAIMEMNAATDWESFKDGAAHWGFPCQNIVYADVANNIGYIMRGQVPIRAKGDGMTPVPGWNGHDWVDWIAQDELPAFLNPPQGFIATANNRVVGDDYPYMLTNEWLAPYRAQRITEMLQASLPVSLEDNMRLHQDTVSLLMRRFMEAIRPYLPDLPTNPITAELQKWDGDMHADSIAATVAYGWLFNFMQMAFTQAVGAELTDKLLGHGPVKNFSANPYHKGGFELALRWLENGAPEWMGDVHPLVIPAFEQTMAILQQEFGSKAEKWAWGKVRPLTVKNPLALIPGLGKLWKPVSLPGRGDGYTLNQMENPPSFPPQPINMVASSRMILDVGAWDNSVSSFPAGQSGHIASPHYQDGIQEWYDGRYHPMYFSRDSVETAVAHQLVLFPQAGEDVRP